MQGHASYSTQLSYNDIQYDGCDIVTICCVMSVQVLDELYHKDKGYNRNRVIVLCDEEPDQSIKHVLYTHDASSKVKYLQGSPFLNRVSHFSPLAVH